MEDGGWYHGDERFIEFSTDFPYLVRITTYNHLISLILLLFLFTSWFHRFSSTPSILVVRTCWLKNPTRRPWR